MKFARYNVSTETEIKRYRKKYYRKPYNKKDWPVNAREKYGFNNVWSYDGKILYKINDEVKVYCD